MKSIITAILLFSIPYVLTSQVYTDYLGTGQDIDITVTSSGDIFPATNTINGKGYDLDIQGSSRFLAHASLGATIEDVEYLSQIGIDEWIDEQMQTPETNITGKTIEIIFELYDRCTQQLGTLLCNADFVVSTYMFRYAWWDHIMKNDDHLRQRVAMALSEILVISDQSQLDNKPHGMAYYYDILSNNAFGNYKDLLTEVTLSPAMGAYLSHFNNPKAIAALNTKPDENYAREIMQLFSIGLYELQPNGVRKIDMQTGLWIPTYDNEDIGEMAKVFTGLSGSKWENDADITPVRFGRNIARYSFIDPLIMYEQFHEPGEKVILKNHTIPAGQDGMKDVEDVIDILFNHENVGPFLGTRLIQRLVKSNPTPDYVERISNVFADNGSGVRGDLGAVIKAILTDPEAMECYWIDDEKAGMLRSPMLRYTQLMKSLKAETESEEFWNAGRFYQAFAGQHLLSSPTVFNFYLPDYVPNSDFANESLVGPEYQILNSSTSSNYVNYMFVALMQEYLRDDPVFGLENLANLLNNPEEIRYTPDTRPYGAKLSDDLWLDLIDYPEQLIDYLDILLTNGQLSDDKKARLLSSITNSFILNKRDAAHYAVFMIMIDPEYVIMK